MLAAYDAAAEPMLSPNRRAIEADVIPGEPAPDPRGRCHNSPMQRRVEFCRTSSGQRVPYLMYGQGPSLVIEYGWLTHLEHGSDLPGFEGFMERLACHCLLLLYDKPGFGLATDGTPSLSLDSAVEEWSHPPRRADEFTRLALGCRVDLSIGTSDVMEELEELFLKYGKPKIIRCDNGREFVSATLISWLTGLGIELAFIEKGQPQQNCFVERFNGTMRSEVLDVEDFDTVIEARVVLKQWSFEQCNNRRPHRGHGMLTPRQFADNWKAGGK